MENSMKITKSDVGREVYDILLGKGKIIEFLTSNNKLITYCVVVEMAGEGTNPPYIKYYTQEGSFDVKFHRTLFPEDVIIMGKKAAESKNKLLKFYKDRPWWKIWAKPEDKDV